jgi:hypothetical protein
MPLACGEAEQDVKLHRSKRLLRIERVAVPISHA